MAVVENFRIGLHEEVPEIVLRTGTDDDDDGTSEEDVSDTCKKEIEPMLVEEQENSEEDDNEKSSVNSGWADAMAKILKTNKPKGKRSIVLAKAKKLSSVSKVPKAPDLSFEIDGEVKEEKSDTSTIPIKSEDQKLKRIKKKEWHSKGRTKPSILDKNREKILTKVATKGVVQLFNTVRDHQKTINAKLTEASSERKREKVLQSIDKRAFLDVLMGPTATKKNKVEKSDEVKPEKKEDTTATWNVLRDDFMMGGTLKDWDKQTNADEETTLSQTKKKKHSLSNGDASSNDKLADNDGDDEEDEDSDEEEDSDDEEEEDSDDEEEEDSDDEKEEKDSVDEEDSDE